MSWFFVILAGLFEVAGVTGIARWNERASVPHFALMAGGFLVSFLLLSLAMRDMEMGTAYAVWTGIGTVGSALVGILFHNEPRSLRRMLFISMVLAAVVGLKLLD